MKRTTPKTSKAESTYRIPRWAALLMVGMFCISLAACLVAGVTVLNSRGEHDRSCEVSARSIHLALEGIYNLPQRESLPKRTAAEEKERQAAIAVTLQRIDDQLEKC